MAIAFVQQAHALSGSATQSQSVTWGSNTTTGNLIVVLIGLQTSTSRIINISDSQSNSYTFIRWFTRNPAIANQEIWYAKNIVGGTTPTITVTCDKTTGLNFPLTVAEYSGLDTVQPLDRVAYAPIPGSTNTPNWICATDQSIGAANELIFVGGWANDNSSTWTVGTGYGHLFSQVDASNGNQMMQDAIVSSSGIQTATAKLSTSNQGVMSMVTFSATTMPPFEQSQPANNFQFLKVGDPTGNAVMSVTEKIR